MLVRYFRAWGLAIASIRLTSAAELWHTKCACCLGLMTRFQARMTVECQPGRRDEFPTHSGGCRKIGCRIARGTSPAIRRPAVLKGELRNVFCAQLHIQVP